MLDDITCLRGANAISDNMDSMNIDLDSLTHLGYDTSDPSSLNSGLNVIKEAKDAGFKVKSTIGSYSEDLKHCGKDWGVLRNNPMECNNCTRASTAYILRRMGLDVSPNKIHSMTPDHADAPSLMKCFKSSIKEAINVPNGDIETAKNSVVSQIKDMFPDQKAFGFLLAPGIGRHGHAMAFEKMGDEVVLLDPQSGTTSRVDVSFIFTKMGKFSNSWSVIRCDDCGIDGQELKTFVH